MSRSKSSALERAAAAAGDFLVEVEGLRREIEEHRSKLRVLSTWLPTRAEAETAARQLVDRLAAQVRPPVDALVAPPEASGSWLPAETLLAQRHPMGLLCSLFPSEVLAWFVAAIEARGDWPLLTHAERKREAERIRAEILDLERREESLISDAERVGIAIARRVDADPRAVLGLD